MSAIDDVLNVCRDPIFKPTEELEAEARADLQAAQERIAEQARQVAEARRIFIENIFIPINNCNCQSCVDCRAWLAANPAPLIDDQAAVDRFNDWRREREEDFSRRIEAAS